MFVQAVDGKFYQNPSFANENAIVEFCEEGVFLYRKGHVTWRTAVRELTAFGIVGRNQVPGDDGGLSDKIIGGKLTPAICFAVRVIKPIPVPADRTPFTDVIGTTDEVLRFDQKRKRKPKCSNP